MQPKFKEMSFAENLVRIAEKAIEVREKTREPLIVECTDKLEKHIKNFLTHTAEKGLRENSVRIEKIRLCLVTNAYDDVVTVAIERVSKRLGVRCDVGNVNVTFKF